MTLSFNRHYMEPIKSRNAKPEPVGTKTDASHRLANAGEDTQAVIGTRCMFSCAFYR